MPLSVPGSQSVMRFRFRFHFVVAFACDYNERLPKHLDQPDRRLFICLQDVSWTFFKFVWEALNVCKWDTTVILCFELIKIVKEATAYKLMSIKAGRKLFLLNRLKNSLYKIKPCFKYHQLLMFILVMKQINSHADTYIYIRPLSKRTHGGALPIGKNSDQKIFCVEAGTHAI